MFAVHLVGLLYYKHKYFRSFVDFPVVHSAHPHTSRTDPRAGVRGRESPLPQSDLRQRQPDSGRPATGVTRRRERGPGTAHRWRHCALQAAHAQSTSGFHAVRSMLGQHLLGRVLFVVSPIFSDRGKNLCRVDINITAASSTT